ncbi:uncharacterized protein LOC107607305 [Arachis ipaensis]|uniref:uncharacterized protein LOC107607305 n=1 Tax=Arachis ipaensis TaxID=130454 RepID=UPI0007AF9098|nr:uncharacterized protein LOC107607305 [Arachis ipaensis]XP_025664817.1 uncharacterized protein LOC112763333 [Arachis hypogaea]
MVGKCHHGKKHITVNGACYEKLSFMDAYSGYNQILMHPSDQSKTAFITEYGYYYYKVMPFGLKNAGIILEDGNGNVIEQSLHFFFKASNNQSEYKALIASLKLTADLNIAELKVYCDSLLIV